MRRETEGFHLFDTANMYVARLSRKAENYWLPRLSTIRQIRLLAMVHRTADQESEQYRSNCRVTEWEFPIAEVTDRKLLFGLSERKIRP